MLDGAKFSLRCQCHVPQYGVDPRPVLERTGASTRVSVKRHAKLKITDGVLLELPAHNRIKSILWT